MKKLVSVLAAVALGAVSLCSGVVVSGAETAKESTESGSIIVLGDSIAAGYSMHDTVKYDFAQLCGDYLGKEVKNHARSGNKISDLTASLSDEQVRNDAASSDIVIISIGGSDLIGEARDYTSDFLSSRNILNDGYTADDVNNAFDTYGISSALLGELKPMINMDRFENSYGTFNVDLQTDLVGPNVEPGGLTYDVIMPELKKNIRDIHSLNPDAKIVVASVYQPFQMSQQFWNENFGAGGKYESYGNYANSFRFTIMEKIVRYYTDYLYITQRDMLYEEGLNFYIANIYEAFTSLPLVSGRLHWNIENDIVPNPNTGFEGIGPENQGNTHYFTDMQTGDFYPNQKGHIAIAAEILKELGNTHSAGSDCLLKTVFDSLEDKADYPSVAKKTYDAVVGNADPGTEPTEPPTPAVTTTAPATADNGDLPLGDVDEDGSADSTDASLVLAEYALISTGHGGEFTERQVKIADVNYDGSIDSSDASDILSFYAFTATGGTDTLPEFLEKRKQAV